MTSQLLRSSALRVNRRGIVTKRPFLGTTQWWNTTTPGASVDWRSFASSSSNNPDDNLNRPLPFTTSWWSLPATSHDSASSSLWSSGWWAKIPKGFENFGVSPNGDNNSNSNKKNEKTDSKTSTSTDSTTTNTTNSNKPSSFLSQDENDNNSKNSKKKSSHNNNKRSDSGGGDDPQNIPGLLALLILVLAARNLLDSETVEGQEITFVEFRNRFLLQGQVERIEVVNEKVARVILKDHAVDSATSTTEWKDDPTSSTTSEWDSSANNMDTTRNNHNKNAHYFYIGSVESLEQKLTAAQQAWHPSQWIEVVYVTKTDWARELIKLAPMLLMVGTIFFMMRGMPSAQGGAGGGAGGGMGRFFNVGKSTAKKFEQQDVAVRFSDVAGCQQAKAEIVEFVDFLKHPERFTKLGARIPKGALLCGPPGTGKTLLAKAVAGEAGVPFYSVAGSDFLEMFVGVGPSRVRDLFKEARKSAPSIVFIDEIDAVGRQRGRGGFSGGVDERDNTLNQMLVEMDGFSPTTGVVVLAGTNRVDILDQALTRPGRFDRQITVDRPDLAGRKEIFLVHLQGITIDESHSLEDFAGRLAGLTPGFTGADIANICNEAAIVAARRSATSVELEDFEKATDRVIGGLESHKIMSAEEKSIVAHHEAGHAVAGWFLENADPLLKVTIIPRSSGALGFAQYLPKEIYLRNKAQILDMVSMALAGRAAEEVFFGRVTTGASDDLRRVTDIAYGMIQTYGMNARVGQLAFARDEGGMPGDKPYSEATSEVMDEEARAMIDDAYQQTVALIRERQTEVQKVANLLLEKETITHDDIMDAIGPRPFEGDKQYQEYVSMRKQMREEMETKEEDAKESTKAPEEEEEDHDGGFTPTPGLA
ncbi:metalloprotease FTSH [Seminavis robusta]|uniref:Metalloprotease FTSH n=1 Tax=Seminavis robusta TaxID=568900 RepID=A0A9N8DAZ6_9STRA|nr:metalloprotease FTSH [Seminavis robusta]|eukprot:Sro15_g011340.1 metalloprotease FTSH (874) ;mRNA; r:138223-141318